MACHNIPIMARYFLIFLSILILFSCSKEFNPEFSTTIDDRDGKTYNTVTIGDQIWLEENLKYLPEVQSPVKVSDTISYYYVYDYYGERVDRAEETLDYKTYGVLYNFSAAQNACPSGWRIPNENDWEALINTVGLENGKELRSKVLWVSHDKGRNGTGFNALPAGCQERGYFRMLGEKAGFWSNRLSEDYPGRAFVWGFHSDPDILEADTTSRANAFPVRCVKN